NRTAVDLFGGPSGAKSFAPNKSYARWTADRWVARTSRAMTAERWSGCQRDDGGEEAAAGIMTTEVEAVAGRRPRVSVAIDALNIPETTINIRGLTIRLHGLF